MNELAEPFPITLQAISKHLKVLERAGLIARGRSAQLRPSRLQGEALKEAADWLADYRRLLGRELRPPRRAPARGLMAARARDHDHPRLRRAARGGVAGVDRARASSPAGGASAAGPRRCPRSRMDVRPGGAFRLTIVNDEDGREMPIDAVYREVVEPERLAFGDGRPSRFTDLGDGRTEMIFHTTIT